jgi:hypothetical protein
MHCPNPFAEQSDLSKGTVRLLAQKQHALLRTNAPSQLILEAQLPSGVVISPTPRRTESYLRPDLGNHKNTRSALTVITAARPVRRQHEWP